MTLAILKCIDYEYYIKWYYLAIKIVPCLFLVIKIVGVIINVIRLKLIYKVSNSMDKHSKETRSYNMSRIRSTDSKPEVMVRKYLFSKGLRYRKNVKELPGKPDIVLPKYKTVVFVNGCFWHGHSGCKYYVIPKTNTDYWLNKIKRNISRDAEAYEKLCMSGWNVLIVWECELKKSKIENTLDYLYYNILRNIKE